LLATDVVLFCCCGKFRVLKVNQLSTEEEEEEEKREEEAQ